MALVTGTPPESAKGPRRRHKGQFGDVVPDLIDLGRTNPEQWANLGEWKEEKPAANFVRSVVRGARKDFRPDGAFEAKYETEEPFVVWVRCIDPTAAEEELARREAALDDDTEEDEVDEDDDELVNA
jgi:hypothetical protein